MSVLSHQSLPKWTEVLGYRIEKMLGRGGFGITYLASSLQQGSRSSVAIKEYFPQDCASRAGDEVVPTAAHLEAEYSDGLRLFLEEARTLARFSHPNIVKVERIGTANGTAYMVLEYVEGLTMSDWLGKSRKVRKYKELSAIIQALFGALEQIHQNRFFHRDIAPDNIYIRRDGSPVLLDFGAAHSLAAHRKERLISVIKPGYSPVEQYSAGVEPGPWSDIYALAATLHFALTRTVPVESVDRMKAVGQGQVDPLDKLSDLKPSGYPEEFLTAIDAALALNHTDRPQNIVTWASMMFPQPKPASGRTGDALPKSAKVDIYELDDVICQRSFALYYRARDRQGTPFTVKEYFPKESVIRSGQEVFIKGEENKNQFYWGYNRFKEEAELFARFQHPSIAVIHRLLQANGTIYMLFRMEGGETLAQWRQRLRGVPAEKKIKEIIGSLMDAVNLLHENNVIHLNISPDSIFMAGGNKPVVADLSSCLPDNASRSLYVKDGYSPIEQYSTVSRLNRASDIYSVAATIYRLIANEEPVSAEKRSAQVNSGFPDPMPSLVSLKIRGMTPRFLSGIDAALAIDSESRPQNMSDWRRLLV